MTADGKQSSRDGQKALYSYGWKRTVLMTLLLGALLGSCPSEGVQGSPAAPRCQTAKEWKHWADADQSRLYMNETSGSFLLEYDADGSESSVPTHMVYWTELTLPAGTYKLRTVVRGGHSDTGFQVLVDGAVDAGTHKPLVWSVKSDQMRSLAATVQTSGGRVSLRIRAVSRNKTWSTVGPTTICS